MKRFSFVLALFLVVTSMALATSMLPKSVSIDAKKDGTEMVLFLGQTLSLSLAENPSTGYRWTVEDYKPAVLEQLESVFKAGEANKPGSGGTKIFGFLAKKVGETVLTLEYQRPWAETAKPAKTFSVKIKVQKAGSPHNVTVPDGQKPTHPICLDVQNADSLKADSSKEAALAGTSKSGSVMRTGMKLGELSAKLHEMTGPALKYVSCIEFRPGTPVEYVGIILNTTGSSPRCPNQKLVMDNHHLRVIIDQIISFYGKKAETYEFGFINGMPQPGVIEVTLIGTGLGLPFNSKSGEVMGKLTGAL